MNRFAFAALVLGGFWLLPAGCDAPAQEPTEVSQRAITGGQVETGYPAVGCLSTSTNPASIYCNCTGTLIAPNLVLSAKHCGPMALFMVGNSQGAPTETRPVDKVINFYPNEGHGDWNGDKYPHDLAIYHLSFPIYDVRPLQINTGPVPANTTKCVAVGFGNNASGSSGVKYSATQGVISSGPVKFTVLGYDVWVGMASAIKVGAGSPSDSPPGGTTQKGDSGGPLLCNGVIAGVVCGTYDHLSITDPIGGIAKMLVDGTYYTALDSSITYSSSWVTNVAESYVNEPPVPVVSWGGNRIDLFVRGTDGGVYWKAWDPGLPKTSENTYWYPSMFTWYPMGGFITGTPEPISWGPGRLDVFVRGGDSNPRTDWTSYMSLYHLYWNGSIWNWQYLGGTLAAHPAAVSWGVNRIDVFAVAIDGQMWHLAGDGQNFANWELVPNNYGPTPLFFAGPVKVISTGAEDIDIYAVGADNMLYHMHHYIFHIPPRGAPWPVWAGWDNLGGPVMGTPAVASWDGGREDIFVKGTDNNLYQKVLLRTPSWTWYPSQSGFYSLGGPIDGSPAAASLKTNWLTLLSNGPISEGFATYYKGWFNGSDWVPSSSTWLNLGVSSAGAPTLLANPGSNVVDWFSAYANFTPFIGAYRPDGPPQTHGWSGPGSLGGTVSW
jgi:hypothetical protein